MNADLLLQHFNRISEAPDAVPRLRKFILDLAVRGKLVEQERDYRSQISSKQQQDAPFDIPFGWEWVRLSQIGVTQAGATPPKAHPEYFGDHGLEQSSRLAPAGSLLMVCIGTIGKCQVVKLACSFNQQINALTPSEKAVSRYLYYAANASYFQDAALAASSRTTIAILNKGRWEKLLMPYRLWTSNTAS